MNRSTLARIVVLTTATTSVLAVAVVAFARPNYPPILKKVYPNATINCQSCHDGKPPALKKYGKAVAAELNAAKTKTLTEAMITKLEKKGIRPEGVAAPKKN